MVQNNYNMIAPNTLTHYPDINHYSPDVLDIAIIQSNNIEYSIKNLKMLSSNHNPVLLDISVQGFSV